jgi:endoglucanase
MSQPPLAGHGENGRELLDALRRLTQPPGPSGHEGRAGRALAALLEPLADQVATDRVGSVVAFKKANARKPAGKRLLLAAHLDEIGLMVTGIEAGGYLRFTQIGGFDPRVLLGQEVLIHPGSRPNLELPGVIGAKPPHYQSPSEQESVVPMADLYIDLGLPERRTRSLVSVGDAVTLCGRLAELHGDRVSSKAMDDRACLAGLVRALAILGTMRFSWDVYAVATSQEEAGLGFLGAASSAFRIRPDLAIVLDVTHADMPLAPEHRTFVLGRGPVIAIGPNVHPAVSDRLFQTARRLEIPFQVEPLAGNSGTDAVDIQVAGSGIPTGLVGIPVRYMHTTVETASLADIDRMSRLLAFFISDLDTIDLSWKD